MKVFLYTLLFGALCLCISTKKKNPNEIKIKKEGIGPLKRTDKPIVDCIYFYRNEYKDTSIYFNLLKRSFKTFFIDDSSLFSLSQKIKKEYLILFLYRTGHPP